MLNSGATSGRLSIQYINTSAAATENSVHHRPDEALRVRQATWTVQSTAVHVCDIGFSREGVVFR